MNKSLLLAGIQTAMLLAIGGKFLADRVALPRAWVRVAPVDPFVPLRGRYVSMRVEFASVEGIGRLARLEVRDGKLHGILGDVCCLPATEHGLSETIAFFIPESAKDPSVREPGEELWAEVTVPRTGPPRPIRLAVTRAGERRILDFGSRP